MSHYLMLPAVDALPITEIFDRILVHDGSSIYFSRNSTSNTRDDDIATLEARRVDFARRRRPAVFHLLLWKPMGRRQPR